MEDLRNTFNRHRSCEITGRSRYARWVFPRRLPPRKRAARRVDQSHSPRCSAERPGRDSDRLPVLFSDLCPQRKPLHAVLHGTDRPFSETDRLSVPLAWCSFSLESSIWCRPTPSYCKRRENREALRIKQLPLLLKIAVGVVLYNAWSSIEEFVIAWLLKIIAIQDRFVLSLYHRQMKAISYLGKIEKRLGVPVTTRNWNTIEKVHQVLTTDH